MGDTYQIRDQEQAYFLTFQVVGWADIFTRQVYRDIIIDSLMFCRKERALKVFAYVIMSNHIHTIWQSQSGDLSGTIRDFKKFTAKAILNELTTNPKESRKDWLDMIFRYHAKYNKRNTTHQFWTHENHAVELSTNAILDSRLNYIHQNPVRAGWVDKPEDYLYSSARNYAGMETKMEIDLI
ncbi:MAG TPA: transposase [Cryomorphaceae bacterium]|nr:transposase [Owenweeksia sp.]MBF99389.1 transposase [Owenweeksia sp.]HAD97116.1 transposase [Cryomorphaceae bacterium]HBF19797.1 transposase [Cryomorphaceae bacterium]|tara:strand:- start:2029 stop:2574 length:546 start_codon:yes stop_codon:yes gene_type:complete